MAGGNVNGAPDSEHRSERSATSPGPLVWEADADGRVVADSPSWRAYTGQTLEQWTGDGWLNAAHPDDRSELARQWRAAVVARRPLDTEFRLHHAASGSFRWTSLRAQPVTAAHDAVERWIAMNVDIHAHRLGAEALRESERRLAFAFEALPVGVCILDDQGRIILRNPEMQRFVAAADSTAVHDQMHHWRGAPPDAHLTPDDFPAARALRGDSVAGMEMIYTAGDGREIWTRVSALPMRTSGGEVCGAVACVTDITPLKTALRHEQTLLAELQHRVRNTLAVIRSVVRRTAENSATVDDFASHLDGRIGALSRVQLALTRDPHAGFDLAELISEELRACAAHEGEQFTLEGAPVRLKPKAAESIGLAIHELATNAIKYGAFTVRQGRIDVRWRRLSRGSQPWLLLDWKESGMEGHSVAEQRHGFGTLLLQETLRYALGAEVTRLFEPDGFHCEIAFPLGANAT